MMPRANALGNNLNSALEHATDMIQKPADRTLNLHVQSFQFHFHY